jgi:hypothetical protein
MGNALTALFIAAGVAAFVYSRMGRRIGYGNAGNVWKLVAISFVMTYLMVFILLKTLVTLN